MPTTKKLNIKKLSVAIMQVMVDFEISEKDPNLVIDMRHWHQYYLFKGTPCSVCFAASFMVQSLKAKRDCSHRPGMFPRETKMLKALDQIRQGNIYFALSYLYLFNEDTTKLRCALNKTVALQWLMSHEYADNPKAFKRHLRSVGRMLARRGF